SHGACSEPSVLVAAAGLTGPLALPSCSAPLPVVTGTAIDSPAEDSRARSVPPVLKPRMSALGRYRPVLRSLDHRSPGVPAVPSASAAPPLNVCSRLHVSASSV